MSKSIGSTLKPGQAFEYPIASNPNIVLENGLVVIDPNTKDISVGDGVTPGGVLPKGKIWKVPAPENINDNIMVVGDYVLVNDVDYYYVMPDGVVPVILVEEIDSGSLIGWNELTLFQGWDMSADAIGNARVRKDGNLVTIDAVLEKNKSSDWSPFRLPTWARPNKTVYQTIEVNTSRGADPLVIYPDGYLYPRKIYTKQVSRVSIQLTFWIDTV